ncbi:hypothetical protein K474DRAFT_1458387 [Panus rudis PR-1116 ss-1]|nr:hypothetical protein K474DRAFT_1458387 [Panus rudis PR-1116 ss-1]
MDTFWVGPCSLLLGLQKILSRVNGLVIIHYSICSAKLKLLVPSNCMYRALSHRTLKSIEEESVSNGPREREREHSDLPQYQDSGEEEELPVSLLKWTEEVAGFILSHTNKYKQRCKEQNPRWVTCL